MDKKTRSILEELEDLVPTRDKYIVIEARASHVIASVINLIKLIKENFPLNESTELTNRLLLSIKNEDQQKFKRGIQKLNEQHKGKKIPK